MLDVGDAVGDDTILLFGLLSAGEDGDDEDGFDIDDDEDATALGLGAGCAFSLLSALFSVLARDDGNGDDNASLFPSLDFVRSRATASAAAARSAAARLCARDTSSRSCACLSAAS